MSKILAHVHIYYPEMWQELKNCLNNISIDYDLYVTIVKEDNNLKADILAFKPETHIEIVPNKGFDVAPFLAVLNKVSLKDYDYIIKLHTKRDMPLGYSLQGYDMSHGKHRAYLMNFISSNNNFKRCINAFECDKHLGMIGDFRLIEKNDKLNQETRKEALRRLKLLGFKAEDHTYVMGTMFMARAMLFEPIKQMKLTSDDFTASVRYKDILPYAFERIFGYTVGAQGYKINDPLHNLSYKILFRIYTSIRNFIYRKKVDYNGKTSIKICKIPVYSSKNKGVNNN